MKRIHYAIKRLALAGLLTATAAHAEWTFETDFNDDYPDGTEVYGTTVVEWIDDDAEDGAHGTGGLHVSAAQAAGGGLVLLGLGLAWRRSSRSGTASRSKTSCSGVRRSRRQTSAPAMR